MGIDGRIFPVAAAPKKARDETGEGAPMELGLLLAFTMRSSRARGFCVG